MKKLSVLLVVLFSLLMLFSSCECKHENCTDATCDTPAICLKCEEKVGSAIGHTWQDATCTEPKTCSVCKKTDGNDLGHTWQDATCKTPKTCSVCQKIEGAVIDHKYSDGKCSMCDAEDPVAAQYNLGKDVYGNLNAVNSYSSLVASSIYDAWYFAIYKSDKDSYLLNVDSAIRDFALAVGFSQTEIKTAIDQYLTSLGLNISDVARLSVLGTNSGAVNVTLIAYQNSGLSEYADQFLADAKNLLKEMSPKYEEDTYYSILKQYYSDSLLYYEFISSPSGTFAQLSNVINNYESTIKKHQNDLSFLYEE